MATRHLIVGLDGADLGLIQAAGPQQLPQLFRLMERGAYAALKSFLPPATLPNWLGFLTGVDPSHHGVFDFTSRRGYRVAFDGATRRARSTFFTSADRKGMRCACLGFPGTWPPERLDHGVVMSGWDSPVAFSANASFVWPQRKYQEWTRRFGPLTFDDVNEFVSHDTSWLLELPQKLSARVERKAAFYLALLEEDPWDVFACYFGESDTAAHHLFNLHDPKSPRRPTGAATSSDGLLRVYRQLDAALGDLVSAAGEEAEITVVSDHGFGGSSDKVLYLNQALAEAGLLAFKKSTHSALPKHLKDAALFLLKPQVREMLFRLGGTWMPSRLESALRFGSIDMSRTIAFSDELNYFPSVSLNLRGREPEGVVSQLHRHESLTNVRQALLALRDPWNNQPVVKAVHLREELYFGPLVERAPDLILEFNLDRDYSYNLLPSSYAAPGAGAWRKLSEEEYCGRKGRSMAGSHRERGLWIAAGPQVRARGEVLAKMTDATATCLARMDLPLPHGSAGRVPDGVLGAEGVRTTETAGPAPTVPPLSEEDRSLLEKRLRALGYLD